jgi:beta-fructofuranosidase
VQIPESLFFQPDGGWVGDVIPFEADGVVWLFYLLEIRSTPKPGTGWAAVSTRDFVAFEDHGVVLPAGSADDCDFNAYTGSIVAGPDGTLHLFYTGHNPAFLGPDGTTPLQVVMHAISSGRLDEWVKQPADTFGASAGYEPGDWRDPFVFQAAENEPWRMLLAARHEDGPPRRRGVVAQLLSDDLVTWRPAPAFWDPRRYVTQECPDVFQWGDWWYLVYSEFSESFTTRYRMSRSPDGPWLVPERDTVDGRAFYASKTVALGDRRFFCGWIASKENDSDDGPYQWAGTMSILEATQHHDGSLGFRIPPERAASLSHPVELTFDGVPASPVGERLPQAYQLAAPDGYAAVVCAETVPERALITVTVDIAPDTTECGVLLRSSPDGDEAYVLRLEPKRSRLVLDRWPRLRTGEMQWQISGDVPFALELERPCSLEPGEHTITIMTEGSILVAVIDDEVALSARIYDRGTGSLGLFAGEGSATFRNLRLCT